VNIATGAKTESVWDTCWTVRLPNAPTPLRGKLNAPSVYTSSPLKNERPNIDPER